MCVISLSSLDHYPISRNSFNGTSPTPLVTINAKSAFLPSLALSELRSQPKLNTFTTNLPFRRTSLIINQTAAGVQNTRDMENSTENRMENITENQMKNRTENSMKDKMENISENIKENQMKNRTENRMKNRMESITKNQMENKNREPHEEQAGEQNGEPKFYVLLKASLARFRNASLKAILAKLENIFLRSGSGILA